MTEADDQLAALEDLGYTVRCVTLGNGVVICEVLARVEGKAALRPFVSERAKGREAAIAAAFQEVEALRRAGVT